MKYSFINQNNFVVDCIAMSLKKKKNALCKYKKKKFLSERNYNLSKWHQITHKTFAVSLQSKIMKLVGEAVGCLSKQAPCRLHCMPGLSGLKSTGHSLRLEFVESAFYRMHNNNRKYVIIVLLV